MTDTYTFDHAQESDRAAVLAVYHACVGLPGCTWDDDYPSAETFDSDLAHDWVYCLRQGDDVVGVVSLGAFGEHCDDGVPWSEARNHCEIGRIAVLPGARGQGLGRRLLELSLDEARRQGFDAMRLLVSPENPPALALYRRAGFRTVGEEDRFDQHWLCQELSLTHG